MITSNCTVSAPWLWIGLVPQLHCGSTLVERATTDSAEWDQTVRRVMSPTRWRKSTRVFVGLAVLAFVAATTAATNASTANPTKTRVDFRQRVGLITLLTV